MALKGKQKKLDKNNNNRIDAQDFKMLRAGKKKGGMFKGYSKPFETAAGPGSKGTSTIVGVKPNAKLKGVNKRKKFKTMDEMRKAKGFKPGETAAQFNKRRMALAGAKEAAKATKIGKIVAPIALAGVAATQYLKSKMKKKEKKMGGGMMKRYSKGGGADMGIQKDKDRLTERDIKNAKRAIQSAKAKRAAQGFLPSDPMPKKMGGGMMKKPMGYVAGGGLGMSPQKRRPQAIARTRRTTPKKKDLEARAYEAGRDNVFSNFRKAIPKAEKQYASIPSGMKKNKETDADIKMNLLKSNRKDPFKEFKDSRREVFATERMGGGMMNKPMGYKAGKSVKVKCKLGRNKPTKMY